MPVQAACYPRNGDRSSAVPGCSLLPNRCAAAVRPAMVSVISTGTFARRQGSMREGVSASSGVPISAFRKALLKQE